jgi:diguanylate cyclase (GGDEF)-like protein
MKQHGARRDPDGIALRLLDADPLSEVLQMAADQAQLAERLAALASSDPLTGLDNRRGFTAEATRRLDLTRRKQVGSVLVMIDLDHFRQFNDRHGWDEGDGLLEEAVRRWTKELRAHDVLGRWSGDQFMVLLSDCGAEDAAAVCERMRCVTPAGQTFSAGLAFDGDGTGFEELVVRAAEALQEAKRNGRNRSTAA